MINERLGIDDKKYILVDKNEDQCKFFKELNTYIPKLLFFLWNKPKIVSEIIHNSEIQPVREHLAPLVVNNFYENIISSNYIEDNLIYVIALLLKKEIDSLETTEDSEKFLEETPCGCVLEQLRTKNDIKYFFKNIINSVIEKMEVEYSGSEINLNVKQIQEKYQQTKDELDRLYKKTGKKKKILDNEFYRKIIISNVFSFGEEDDNENGQFSIPKDNIDPNLFNSKYIPDLTKSELENQIKLLEKNKKMVDYCDINIKRSQGDDDYANQKLLQNIFDSPISKEVLASYQIDFSKIINLINKLIQNLLNDLYLLPYSVKCICKIILLLIKKKFKNIKETEINSFMAKFFVDKLFAPIFENPGLGANIDNIIISGTTKHNAAIINIALKKLTSGRLFRNGDDKESDYTPLNWFFIDKMPEVYKFFENITKVTLPPFIEKLINNELPSNFELDYFAENTDEVICHRSICYTLEDLMALLECMNNCRANLFPEDDNKDKLMRGLRLTFEKLVSESCTKSLKELQERKQREILKIQDPKSKKKEVYKEVEGKEILNYFLITDIVTNERYTKLFEIKQEKANFSIKELKKTQTDSEIMQNNIIKVKNFFCNLLYNYRTLVSTDFNEGTTNNTNGILTELKKFIKSSDFVIDGSIPSEWYVSSLLEYLKKIPENLTQNDCRELYNQIEHDINNSIKELDFEALSVCLGKVKFAKRVKINYERTSKFILNTDLNEKVQNIIEKEMIPVEINFKYNKKDKEFTIEERASMKEMQLNLLDNVLEDPKKKKRNICKTIKIFTKKFPDLVKNQQLYDRTLNDMEEEMKITEKLTSYFDIIKKHIEKTQKVSDENEMNEINNKIYDYVMEKIYEKIYPIEPDPQDYQIFRRCVLLSWAEPKHFIVKKTNYVFDSFLPDVIEFFSKMDKEKSPRIKFIYMKKIFGAINDVLRFNGGDGTSGVDDQMPILNYAFIKARPQHISSNCKYMNLFIGKNRNRSEGSQLTQLSGICEHVVNLTAKQLNGVTDKEFEERCKQAQFE
jgi:hypothetical protein